MANSNRIAGGKHRQSGFARMRKTWLVFPLLLVGLGMFLIQECEAHALLVTTNKARQNTNNLLPLQAVANSNVRGQFYHHGGKKKYTGSPFQRMLPVRHHPDESAIDDSCRKEPAWRFRRSKAPQVNDSIQPRADGTNRTKKWLSVGVVVAFAGLVWSGSASVANAAISASTLAAGAASRYRYIPAVPSLSNPNCQLAVTAAVVLWMVQALSWNMLILPSVCLQRAAMWYAVQLHATPIITKAVTAGVIAMLGDSMAQWLEYKLARRKTLHMASPASVQHTLSIHGGSYNLRRGVSLLVDGVFLSGPLMHYGYNLFESILPAGTSSLAALSHVIADSILLDGFFVASTFLATGIMEGYTHKDLIPQFKADYFPTLQASFATTRSLLSLSFASRCATSSWKLSS
jgi:hypothetical protein